MLSLQLSAVRKIPKSIVKGCFSYSSLFRILQGETEWEIEIFTSTFFFVISHNFGFNFQIELEIQKIVSVWNQAKIFIFSSPTVMILTVNFTEHHPVDFP